MDIETIGVIVFGGANVAAWVWVGRMFANGKIYSSVAVDRITEEAQNMTTKVAQEISTDIQKSVKMGVIEAFSEMNKKP